MKKHHSLLMIIYFMVLLVLPYCHAYSICKDVKLRFGVANRYISFDYYKPGGNSCKVVPYGYLVDHDRDTGTRYQIDVYNGNRCTIFVSSGSKQGKYVVMYGDYVSYTSHYKDIHCSYYHLFGSPSITFGKDTDVHVSVLHRKGFSNKCGDAKPIGINDNQSRAEFHIDGKCEDYP